MGRGGGAAEGRGVPLGHSKGGEQGRAWKRWELGGLPGKRWPCMLSPQAASRGSFRACAHWNSGLRTGSVLWALSSAMKVRLTPTEKSGKRSTLGVSSSWAGGGQRRAAKVGDG